MWCTNILLFSIIDTEKEFDVPELIYNLNLLVDMTESDILHTDRQ